MKHIVIHKIETQKFIDGKLQDFINGSDPSYEERVQILHKVGNWKRIALEIYPKEQDLVDDANVYHLWEIENERFLPFPTGPAFVCPELNKSIKIGKLSIKYSERNVDGFKYLYVQGADGRELKWKEKQFIKNEMCFKDVTAVELVMEEGMNKDYSVLICLPYNFQFDFGLYME